MGEVITPRFLTTMPLPVEHVLDCAKECKAVLVIGWDKDGEMQAYSSMSEVNEQIYMVELFKAKLLGGEWDLTS